MRQTNKSNVQDAFAKEQLTQFDIAKNEVFSHFDSEYINPVIDSLILGWISSNYFSSTFSKKKRIEILSFYSKLKTYFELAEKETDIHLFLNTINPKEYNSLKILDTSFFAYLNSPIANNKNNRNSVIYLYGILKKFIVKTNQITKKSNLY